MNMEYLVCHQQVKIITRNKILQLIFILIMNEENKKEIYFMALIDVLTHYGLKKRSANVAKTVKYGDQEISTVKPDQYAKRFLDFVNKIIN